jgi:hypothetical protein
MRLRAPQSLYLLPARFACARAGIGHAMAGWDVRADPLLSEDVAADR